MEDNKSMTVKKTVKSGITFGSALAMVISYTTWKSVGWAIFHGLLSWVYVIYFLLRYYIGSINNIMAGMNQPVQNGMTPPSVPGILYYIIL